MGGWGGNESMIFLGYSVSDAHGVVLCASAHGVAKYIISLCMVFCFCFCTFPMRIGKNGFDCEQQQRERRERRGEKQQQRRAGGGHERSVLGWVRVRERVSEAESGGK